MGFFPRPESPSLSTLSTSSEGSVTWHCPGASWGFTIFRTYTTLDGAGPTNDHPDPTVGTGTGTKYTVENDEDALMNSLVPMTDIDEISVTSSSREPGSSHVALAQASTAAAQDHDECDDTVLAGEAITELSICQKLDDHDSASTAPDATNTGKLPNPWNHPPQVVDRQWAKIYRKIRYEMIRSCNIPGRRERSYMKHRLRTPVEYQPGANPLQLIEFLRQQEREIIKPYILSQNEDGFVTSTESISNTGNQNLGIIVDEEVARSVLAGGKGAWVKVLDSTYEPQIRSDGEGQGEEVYYCRHFGGIKATLRSLFEVYEDASRLELGEFHFEANRVFEGHQS